MVRPEPAAQGSAQVVTLTANPSIDRTIALPGRLTRGGVLRARSVTEQAAGKGVNVARVLAAGGVPACAVLAALDPAFEALLERDTSAPPVVGVPLSAGERVRVNMTLTEADGTTTKINEPGPTLAPEHLDRARALLVDAARGAQWVALCGALAPGTPASWYAQLAGELRALGVKVAIDTSGPALDALIEQLPHSAFDLIKPNAEELAQLTAGDGAALEAAAAAGDVTEIARAARTLHEQGIANVLVTLGGAGALLVDAAGARWAGAPPVTVRSTVGAGDSSIAGFILAETAGLDPAARLTSALRHGSAAAALPGTGVPTPADLPDTDVDVVAL